MDGWNSAGSSPASKRGHRRGKSWGSWGAYSAIAPGPTMCADHDMLLAVDQERCIAALRRSVATEYDPQRQEHVELLERLWAATRPGVAWPGPKADAWKGLGFQGCAPETDFRGGGLFSLELLVGFAEAKPELLASILRHAERNPGCAADDPDAPAFYPFAAAGINVTFMITELLDLRTRRASAATVESSATPPSSPRHIEAAAFRRPPTTESGKHFLATFRTHEGAQAELCRVFVEALVHLDRVWVDSGATYMDFPTVLAGVRARILEQLPAHA